MTAGLEGIGQNISALNSKSDVEMIKKILKIPNPVDCRIGFI